MEDADPRPSTQVVTKALFTETLWQLEQTVVISDAREPLEVGLSSGMVDVNWHVTEDWLIACHDVFEDRADVCSLRALWSLLM